MPEMQAVCDLVGLDQVVGEDHRFAIKSYLPEDCLQLSLEQHGMLFPPWVWANEHGGCSLVDGFKRIAWAKQKGLKRIQCLVFPPFTQYEQLLVLRVEGKLFGPPLNAAEKARIIATVNRASVEPYFHQRLLPALRIPPRTEVVEKWCRLSTAGENLLHAAASEAIAERAALELVDWGEEERAAALALLLELRCSASIQMEIFERVTEIALGAQENRMAVLCRPQLQDILNHSRENHRQKTQAVRELLTRWRFPRLQAREALLVRDLASLALPSGTQLLHPPAFEGDEWRLQVAFTRPGELKSLLERLVTHIDFGLLQSTMKPGG
jgi:hypothetical protein